MICTGKLLDAAMESNPKGTRIFSPDVLESNKLDAVLDRTSRNF
jgi:xylulose-5-phosphate/fructose-6-phosphate phosphoketolase